MNVNVMHTFFFLGQKRPFAQVGACMERACLCNVRKCSGSAARVGVNIIPVTSNGSWGPRRNAPRDNGVTFNALLRDKRVISFDAIHFLCPRLLSTLSRAISCPFSCVCLFLLSSCALFLATPATHSPISLRLRDSCSILLSTQHRVSAGNREHSGQHLQLSGPTHSSSCQKLQYTPRHAAGTVRWKFRRCVELRCNSLPPFHSLTYSMLPTRQF